MEYFKLFEKFLAPISGRYITNEHILPFLPESTVIAGWSVQDRDVFAMEIGSGPTRVLIWSQMHGNESTTTKAVVDLVRLLSSADDFGRFLLEKFTFKIVPILNPDGAHAYTRANANGVDLNRDFVELSQPESEILVQIFESFEPDYCFNMHDQRTIFGVGETGKPATVSFLAPAYNGSRDWNHTRLRAASVIAEMNSVLQQFIPGQVGRFDDTFNINCVGDRFQFHGVPTILVEAGHFPGDYQREQTRKLIFTALLSGLCEIAKGGETSRRIEDYLNIPQNQSNFFDIVYRNVKLNYDVIEINTNFAAQFRETLKDGLIVFESEVIGEIGKEKIFGHREYDCRGGMFSSGFGNRPIPGMPATFFIGARQFDNGIEVEIVKNN